MKLYYARSTCSLAVRIALEEAGASFESVAIRLSEASSPDYLALNPWGAVPLLELDDGQRIGEVSAILQFVAYQYPQAGLTPEIGTVEHFRLLEWLSIISSELHKTFPLFHAVFVTEEPVALELIAQYADKSIRDSLDIIERKIGSRSFLLGERYSVADAYLFTVLRWVKPVGLSLDAWPHLHEYFERIRSRPATQRALQVEKLA